jgi:hypothetical protein
MLGSPGQEGSRGERTEDGLVLAIDGVPFASGHVVKADLVVGDSNGGQVSGDVHCSLPFWGYWNNVHLFETFLPFLT